MKKIFLLFTILLLNITAVFSQEKVDSSLSKYIGAAAGTSTGIGLSYRYLADNLGAQIVFAPIGAGLNIGIAGFKTLKKTNNTRLFLYFAANIMYENYELLEYEDDSDTLKDPIQVEEIYRSIGIGPGLEIYIFKHIVLDIMFGYKYNYDYGYFDSVKGLGFTGEVALYYRF